MFCFQENESSSPFELNFYRSISKLKFWLAKNKLNIKSAIRWEGEKKEHQWPLVIKDEVKRVRKKKQCKEAKKCFSMVWWVIRWPVSRSYGCLLLLSLLMRLNFYNKSELFLLSVSPLTTHYKRTKFHYGKRYITVFFFVHT